MSGTRWAHGPVLKLDLFRERLAWTALLEGERVGPDVDTAREAWAQLGEPARVTLVMVGAAGWREQPGMTIELIEARAGHREVMA